MHPALLLWACCCTYLSLLPLPLSTLCPSPPLSFFAPLPHQHHYTTTTTTTTTISLQSTINQHHSTLIPPLEPSWVIPVSPSPFSLIPHNMPPSSFLSENDRLFINNHSATISPTDMQRMQRPMYPSDIANIAGVQQQAPFSFSSEDTGLWGPYPTTLPTVNPSCIVTSGPNDWFDDSLSPQTLVNPQLSQVSGNRKPSSVDTKLGQSYRVKHGQVTPPSDDSPISNTATAISPQNTQAPYLRSSIENLTEEPSKRRRSTGGARVQGGSQSASGRRGSSLQSTRGSTSVEPGSPDDDRQEKTRARNRLAASKCRQKRKEENTQLENKYNLEKQRHEELTREVAVLRSALVATKDQVLAHSECGHEPIQAYIQGMAKRITIKDEAVDFGGPPTHFYGGPQPRPGGFGFDH
ncbi:hypothetical protein BJY04DRAFT_175741 [Aspergillus karnatakaensis]|uniref:bZIP transcription factor atfB n=1 Tax=Aspergillus karnatakaensis TaxID=1810916 RepID=UPI003CCDB8A9